MLTTWNGMQAINEYLAPPVSHIILSHPAIGSGLLLAEHDDLPYQHYPTGQVVADGRSRVGSIILKGDNYSKDMWECNFLAISSQVDLFNQLLIAQQDDVLPAAIVDNWLLTPISRNIWINVDRQYLSLVGGNSWFRLQFQCWEV